MKKIIPRKVILKKIPMTVLIFSILGFGLFSYDAKKDFINNFQFYHIKSHTALVSYAVSNNNNSNLASALMSLTTNSETENSDIEQKFAKSVPVLIYHGILDEPEKDNVQIDNFKDQMFTLKKAGWQTVSIEDFYAFMQGNKELPDRSFLLTFDDGRKDSYYPVDPILRALNYRAVMFIVTGRSLSDDPKIQNHPFHLNKAEIKKMQKSGRWDIQPHTKEGHDLYPIDEFGSKGHFYSNKLWLADKSRVETNEEFKSRVYEDFLGAKNDIDKKIGNKVISFAFPFGDFGQNSVNFPESENMILQDVRSLYSMAFYQVWAGKGYRFNYPDGQTFLMKRIGVDSKWSGQDLLDNLEIGREKLMPYKDNFSKDNGWQKDWGRMGVKDGSMVIGAHASTTGSMVFLDGTYLWRDYKFKADVNLTKGQTFSLLARHKDGKNYATCVFSESSIRAEQIVDGEKEILSEINGNFSFTGIDREVGIGVYDNVVNCYLDGKIAMRGYNLDELLDYGGIGFKTWDQQIDNSELIIKSVSVEEIK